MKARLSLAAGVVVLVACVLTAAPFPVGNRQAASVPSEAAAIELEHKIRTIEAADSSNRTVQETMDVSELELESYVLYAIKEDIPVRVDDLDLEIRSGNLAATAELFVDTDLSSSQPIVGPLFEGAHSVFFEGAFAASNGQGKFDLQGVKVDGITVPVFLVKALLNNLEQPLDIDAPFRTPIGIDSVTLEERSVRVVY